MATRITSSRVTLRSRSSRSTTSVQSRRVMNAFNILYTRAPEFSSSRLRAISWWRRIASRSACENSPLRRRSITSSSSFSTSAWVCPSRSCARSVTHPASCKKVVDALASGTFWLSSSATLRSPLVLLSSTQSSTVSAGSSACRCGTVAHESQTSCSPSPTTSDWTRAVIGASEPGSGAVSGAGASVPSVRSSTGSAVFASMSPASSTAMLFGRYQRLK